MKTETKLIFFDILAALAGMVFLVFVYFTTLYFLTGDFYHPFNQFLFYKYWMIALILGFGLQAGSYWHLRQISNSGVGKKSSLAANAGTSAFSMIACCAHHLVDFLPFLGFSAIAIFLGKYQIYFFLLGIVSNAFGTALMLKAIRTKKEKW